MDASFPLFQCDTYEVIYPFIGASIQMGAVSGHMFEFTVECPVPRDKMLLTFQGWCILQCQLVMPVRPPVDFPFSFLQALTDGYFADLELMEDKVGPALPDSCLTSTAPYVLGDKEVRLSKLYYIIYTPHDAHEFQNVKLVQDPFSSYGAKQREAGRTSWSTT